MAQKTSLAWDKLPDGILVSDTKYPEKEAQDYQSMFELWFTERFGWCIPTLLISNARRGTNTTARTYATTLDGKPVSIGKGPHVKRTVQVYVRLTRKEALQKFVDLRNKGSETANDIRDRISSRRMRGVLRRDSYSSWM